VVKAVHVDLDVVSLDTGNEPRDGHLESADFLHVEANAKASFWLTPSDRTGDDIVASGLFATYSAYLRPRVGGDGHQQRTVRALNQHMRPGCRVAIGDGPGDPLSGITIGCSACSRTAAGYDGGSSAKCLSRVGLRSAARNCNVRIGREELPAEGPLCRDRLQLDER